MHSMENKGRAEKSEKTHGITEIKSAECTLQWSIKNFSLCNKATGEFIESPTFSSADNDQIMWYLKLYPKGKTEEDKDWLSLSISLRCPKELRVEAEYKISFINDKNIETNVIMRRDTFLNHKSWSYHRFIKRDIVVDENKGLLPNNTLSITCTINAGIGCLNLNVQQNLESKLHECRFHALNDFEQMLQNKTLSDATFICRGKSYQVHKNILAARSPVFSAMFKNNMKERNEDQVIITDMTQAELEELLRFIYAAKLENLQKVSRGLLAAADKYHINDLKEICEDFICHDLTVENAIDTLEFADLHEVHKLKEQVMKFITTHKKSIIASPRFHALKNAKPHLVAQILEFMVIEKYFKFVIIKFFSNFNNCII